jgi:hypothetical protein
MRLRGARATVVGAVVLGVVVGLATPAVAVRGAVVWTKRLNGPGYSRGITNADPVSPDGTKFFITGSKRLGG